MCGKTTMRIYEHGAREQDDRPMELRSELTLRDNGAFIYSESWQDLARSAGFAVAGRWSQTGDKIALCAENTTNAFLWPAGGTIEAHHFGIRRRRRVCSGP